jgi:hypothetical protein
MVQSKRLHGAPNALFCIVGLLVFMGFHQTASCQTDAAANAFLKSADNVYGTSFYDFDQDGSGEYKSKSRAVLYSLASTALPAGLGAIVSGDAGAALVVIGVAAGPSAGIAYAGDYGRAGTGMGIRASGAGIATVGALVYLFESFEVGGSQPVGNFLIAGGLSLTGMSALYDIFIGSPKAVERYNERLERDEMELNPWVNPETGGAGLSLSIRF